MDEGYAPIGQASARLIAWQFLEDRGIKNKRQLQRLRKGYSPRNRAVVGETEVTS